MGVVILRFYFSHWHFPSEIRNIIADVHECQGFPIDYIASAMLVAIAVGIGNTYLVQLKRGWQESAMLYVALVGRPGTDKSRLALR